ncbi:hypothetical protein LCGC14_0621290 [marine sediment metagenome]|uniref:Uncharacterized protein n=1 Tax=marine sediment metagenome TaxID=412755 RepID=A0A0F9RP22_9ZZZZ
MEHLERIQTMIDEGKTYDEIVEAFAAEDPEKNIDMLRTQIRYWYDRFSKIENEEE